MNAPRKCLLSILAILVAVLTQPSAAAATQDELLAKLNKIADHVLHSAESDPELIGNARDCIQAIDEAVAAGIPDSTELKLATIEDIPGAREFEGGGFRLVPLASIKAHICAPAFTKAFVRKVSSAASRAVTWIDKFEHPNDNDLKNFHLLKLAVDEAKECQAKVSEALGSGVPGTTMVEFYLYGSSLTSPLPLSNMAEKVCVIALNFAEKGVKEQLTQETALYAPYLKLLEGDKLRIFKEKKVLGYFIRGHGGKELKSPADFKNSDVWYTSGLDLNKLIPTWSVGGWRFKGMKLIGTHSNSGVGSDYPASAFP